ncbi:MAG TPA: GlxA family transcriptional regulator [Stellaceae bacterium]|nr:GlxA family transcriptional regulator [Stellaceae bacterium]
MRHIVFVAFEQALLLDIAGPLQVFASARDLSVQDGLADPYRLSVVSPKGGDIRTSSGLALATRRLGALNAEAIDTLITVGGFGSRAAIREAALIRWIARRSQRARRVCSVCTGAFLLAEAGLLDGRRAVTHWGSCDALAQRYPRVRVERDPIFLRDGKIWTSAGVTAGIDLALALVEEDLGRAMALRVARHLVVFLKRPGGQSQFSAMLESQAQEGEAFADLHEWMAQHLAADLGVEALAARAGMSPRNFARVYTRRMGTTPAKAVERLRIDAARRALEESDASIESIARRCGFGDEERLRRSFLRRLGVPPRQYRARFTRPEAAHQPSPPS